MKCRTCPAEAKLGRTQCAACLERERVKAAARRSLARAAGVCIRCEEAEPRANRDTCEACAKRSHAYVAELRELELCARHAAPVVGGSRGCERCLKTDHDRYERLKIAKGIQTMPITPVVNGKRVPRPGTLAACVMQFPLVLKAADVAERVNASKRFPNKTITSGTVHRIRWAYRARTEPATAAAASAQPTVLKADDADIRFILKRGYDRIRAALEEVERRLRAGGAA